ncbi:MAG: alpha/beta fold hydrolase [Clostridia bacterium]|nr:alpha/beta fold hydrolase [Clostridia bacterium]
MYAKVNGTRIFFDVAGKQFVPDGPVMREKPVCLVLHGGPGSDHSHFLPGILPLAEHMQLIFLDHRNSGRSEWGPIETSSMKQNSEDAEAVRQYLGLDKIYVLGQSYGGMVAQQYALDHQENLHGLILISTAPSYRINETATQIIMERGTEEQKELWRKKWAGEITDFYDYMKKMESLYHYKYDDEVWQEVVDARTRKISHTEVNNYQRSGELATFDFVPRLPEVKCPVLIVAGEADFVTAPIHSVEMHEAMPQSELHIVERSSHSVFGDRPDYVFPVIEDFVKRTFNK